jgi:phosphoenolpyruvate synthase/pyruvate phosphate dikinase
LQTIASTLNIDRTSLYFILPEEVEKIDDKQYRQELLERTHILIDYASNVGTRLTLTGQEAYDFQTERERKEISHEQEMRGNTGYAGKVKGKVRICLTMESIKAFQEGEILVASMTRPEYVGAIKKSAGIITDE